MRDVKLKEHFHHGMRKLIPWYWLIRLLRGTDFVWFYNVNADGWSLEDKRAPLLAEDKLGTVPTVPLTEDEHLKNNLPDVLSHWQLRNTTERERLRTAQGYDLSLNRYKEVVHEQVDHLAPQEILASLAKLEVEIQQGMEKLEGMLK
ncbi:hypothetical protein AB7310_13525 [Cylindrospermopsis raciborskii UAM/DH-BiRr]|uniref:hypothetical protein n=2 Tax=Cylindrospermopsis raciborskii TaxID=77022 RepID=UPI0038798B46